MSFNARPERESAMAREASSQVSAGQLSSRTGRTDPNPDCLCERQRRFATALLDPGKRVPPGLVGPDRRPSERRFNVYRNNVVAGLVNALKAAFPAVRRIVGAEFFAAMARVYVALEPPRSPVMLEYGATFPGFVETFEPANSVPYLADVARLERAWAEAYHAVEAPPADPAQLAAIDSRSLPQIVLTLHPSTRVVRSPYPAVQIWRMNIDDGVPSALDIFSGGENALVIRPFAEVEVRRIPAGAATFILSLAAKASMADAATLAFDEDLNFDLAGTLRDLFAVSAIVGWNMRDDSQCSQIARSA